MSKNVIKWVGLAAARMSHPKYVGLSYVTCSGGRALATDGKRIHFATLALPEGGYDIDGDLLYSPEDLPPVWLPPVSQAIRSSQFSDIDPHNVNLVTDENSNFVQYKGLHGSLYIRKEYLKESCAIAFSVRPDSIVGQSPFGYFKIIGEKQ